MGELLHTVSVKPRTGLALALSGGGYRATLFHLGLLRRLNEIGLLQQVKAISSVSGGSITNALLAKNQLWLKGRLSKNEWDQTVRDPLAAFCSHNIRTGPILKSLFKIWDKSVAVNQIEKNYYKLLTQQTLEELPEDVDFIFCASDLVHSKMWYFRRKTSESRRTGSYAAGWLREWKGIPVARAVAASSCFPPIFGPMFLGKQARDFLRTSGQPANWEELASHIRLTDGGVYDNLGLEPVWNDYKVVISSDGGKPSTFKATQGVQHLARYTDVIQGQVSSLRRRMLFERHNHQGIDFTAVYSAIDKGDKPLGYSQSFVDDVIVNIRTDLDVFSETEACVLENHSYALADHYLKRLVAENGWKDEIDLDALASPEVPYPNEMDEEVMRHALRKSSKRSLLFTRIGLI